MGKLTWTCLACLFCLVWSGCARPGPVNNPALNPVKVHPAPEVAPAVLVHEGKPAATIVVPSDGTPGRFKGKDAELTVEQHAARELADHIELATGARLPIVDDTADPPGTLVLVGAGRLTARLGITAEDLPGEGFRVKSFDRGLAIVGRLPLPPHDIGTGGTLFGVYDLLERFAGIRWYYPGDDGRVVPKTATLAVPPVHYTDYPVRVKRTMYPWPAKGMDKSADFEATRRRYRAGGSTAVSTGCHTPANFGIHFAEAPECFELGIDGKRNPGMPCYGNPKTVELMIADLERYYNDGDKRPWTRSNGSLWQPPTETTIHISPPDKPVDCHCKYCQATFRPKQRRLGRHSVTMVRFVDAMARQIKARWPEKTVFYLPYSNYTLPVEGTTLPDNVVAGICLMRGAGNAKEPEIFRDHHRTIRGWQAMTSRPIHLWEYLCWPGRDTTLPFQYPHVLKRFQQTYTREELAGSFINGDSGYPGLAGMQWAFQHPTIYCWFRLMWNPDFDVDAAMDDYVKVMYGPAAEPMAGLLKHLIDRWEKTRWKDIPAGHSITPYMVHEETMPPGEAKKLADYLKLARAATRPESLYRRRVDFFGQAVDQFMESSKTYHTGSGLATLGVLKVGGDPTVDGRLDEPYWRDAPVSTMKQARLGDPVPQPGVSETFVQAVWTEKGITFAVKLVENQIDKLRATKTKRDQANVWFDDSVEIFLDPGGKRASYYHFIANSVGSLFDEFGGDATWNAEGVIVGVHVDKTFWSMEMFIPYEAFDRGDIVPPKPGAVWYGNIIRARQAGGQLEYQRWSTLFRGHHADVAAFGKLVFQE